MYTTCAHLAPGETVVVHAAAGGVGSLAVQLARHFRAGRVIATASSDEKRATAVRLGADATTDADPEGLTDRLVEANNGRPVDVVIEMAGGESFEQSLRALAPFGRVIVCWIATREPNHPSTGHLLRHSRSVIGFWLFHCLDRPREMVDRPLAELFGLAATGELRPLVGATYPLAEAALAHTDLANRRTTGKLLLDPWS
jgi:NADPH2:quinone reductase